MININNIAMFHGRLVADPELKSTGNGVEVCTFCIAVDRGYKKDENKDAEKQDADFINCVAWRQTGVFVNKYFTKGKEIRVLGSLQTRKYTDKDGNKRTAYEIVCEQVAFAGSKSGQNASPAAENNPNSAVTGNDDDFPF